ncbi:MAG: FtsW/RodA/SpoVE family cell cycle protein [Fimbriimonadaceae bacterium]|nr:FtsW/RodA/SpoVE family cell cycle protein [Fimbriimonadaceae bacterium]
MKQFSDRQMLTLLLFCMTLLSVGGVAMVMRGEHWPEAVLQSGITVVGLALAGFAILVGRKGDGMIGPGFTAAVWGGWCLALGASVATKFLGSQEQGQMLSLTIGGQNIQPAEFLKLTTLLLTALLLTMREGTAVPKVRAGAGIGEVIEPALRYGLAFVPGLVSLGSIFLLQRDNGTGTILLLCLAALQIVAQPPRWQPFVSLLGALFLGAILFAAVPHVRDRVGAFLGHESDVPGKTQVDFSIESMSAGGVLGVGLKNGSTSNLVAERDTDFVMAVIGEEFGLVGSMVVMGLLYLAAGTLLMIAGRSTGMVRYSGVAVGEWLTVQGSVNALVAAGGPTVGVPMPFISRGGASLLALWLAGMAIAFLVARTSKDFRRTRTAAARVRRPAR